MDEIKYPMEDCRYCMHRRVCKYMIVFQSLVDGGLPIDMETLACTAYLDDPLTNPWNCDFECDKCKDQKCMDEKWDEISGKYQKPFSTIEDAMKKLKTMPPIRDEDISSGLYKVICENVEKVLSEGNKISKMLISDETFKLVWHSMTVANKRKSGKGLFTGTYVIFFELREDIPKGYFVLLMEGEDK